MLATLKRKWLNWHRPAGTVWRKLRPAQRPGLSVCLEPLEDRTLMSFFLSGDPNWVEEGPRPIRPAVNDGSWAGAIESIAVHPNNPLDPAAGYVVYAGSVNGGVWRTDNIDAGDPNNVHWRALTDQQPSLAISASNPPE